jgi:hypothetical protein
VQVIGCERKMSHEQRECIGVSSIYKNGGTINNEDVIESCSSGNFEPRDSGYFTSEEEECTPTRTRQPCGARLRLAFRCFATARD